MRREPLMENPPMTRPAPLRPVGHDSAASRVDPDRADR